MHHRAHHIQHYHHNNYRNSEIFRKIQKTKRNIPFFVLSFSKSSGKIQIFLAKADFLGLVLLRKWKKRNSVILCQFNCWVVYLLKKKRKTYERKKMKKKRLKQKKIVVLSCFKFCWDSFLILWKTPSFSPHCCWNYYLLLYILLREKRKKVGGATI